MRSKKTAQLAVTGGPWDPARVQRDLVRNPKCKYPGAPAASRIEASWNAEDYTGAPVKLVGHNIKPQRRD